MLVSEGATGEPVDLRGGEVAATFARLFDSHAPGLYRYLAARAGTSMADDLVSETFVLALRRRETFDPLRGSPQAWLFGIASNLLRHHHREQARHLAGVVRLVGQQELLVPDAGLDARLDASASVRRLLPDLLRLSDVDRDILLLNAWAGLGPAEIAEALDLPAGTVRSKLSRLRSDLRATARALDAPHPCEEPGADRTAAHQPGASR